jgi:hypothetical protein
MPVPFVRPARRILAPLALASLLVGGWAGYQGFEGWRARDALKSARRDVESSRFATARQRLLGLPSRMAHRDEADYLLGLCEVGLGRPEAAAEAWGRVPRGSPFAARAAVRRARVALPLGRFAVADDLVAAFDDPGLAAEARQTAALIFMFEGRADEASRIFRSGWKSMPSTLATLREVWRLDHNPMPIEVSRAELEQAGRRAPDDDRVWLGQAYLATWSGRFDEAASWLESCRRRRPDDPAVWRAWLARARAADEPHEVWRALGHLTGLDVEPADVAALRAWLAAHAGRADRERWALEERVRLCAEDLAAYDRLAELCGSSPEAAEWRRRKAEMTRDYALYNELLFGDDPISRADELARLAERLGRRFDTRCWWSLRARGHAGDPEAAAALTRLGPENSCAGEASRHALAEDLAELRPRGSPKASTLARSGEAPEFRDDAEAAGLRFVYDEGGQPRTPPKMMGGGVGLLDYDGDGRLDVYVVQGGRFPPGRDEEGPQASGDRLFRNRGDGTFEDLTSPSGLAAMAPGYGFGVAVGDVDGDGHPDLFVTRWRSYALYRNRGDGTFEDATARWGLSGDRDWPTSAAFADLDGDGDLDLYVCHYLAFDPDDPSASSRVPGLPATTYSPLMYRASPDHLFRNDGGRFVDVTTGSGIVDANGRGLGVVAQDLDGDGRVDLFVANDLSANYFFRNRGGFTFEEVGEAAGVAASAIGGYQSGMGIACGDLDGDGRPDLAVTNFYGEGTSLFLNLGGGLFVDRGAAWGLTFASLYRLGFGADFLDSDNDGRLDLATVNGHVVDNRPAAPFAMPSQLLLGTGASRLADVTDRAGDVWRVPRVARGLAVGDLDDDGRLDLVVVSQGTPLAYFHNRSSRRHSIRFRLEGSASNRDAVGARVTIRAGGRRQVRWRSGGGSYLSAGDPRLHFGLGDAGRVAEAEVLWPSGRIDRFSNLDADVEYRLREGGDGPVAVLPPGPRPGR